MNSFLQIGITGGIGSGKTTVCKIFETLSVPVYYADSKAKALMETDPFLIEQIKINFGNEVYDSKQNLNRPYLADKVFNNTEAIEILNKLVHPAVAIDFETWCKSIEPIPAYVLKEAALIFESGSHKLLDKIIVVDAPEQLRLERVMQRDSISADTVKARMSKQMDEKKKLALADYIINNDEVKALIPQVLELHQTFLSN